MHVLLGKFVIQARGKEVFVHHLLTRKAVFRNIAAPTYGCVGRGQVIERKELLRI